jgi:hypothetical protein
MKQHQTKRPAPVPVKTTTSQPQEEESVVRARCLNQIQAALPEIPTCHLETVVEFLHCLELCASSYMTPAEDFIVSLVELYGRYATPDHAARVLEEFRSDFDCAIKAARFMNARYPDLVAQKPDQNYRDVA